MYGRRSPCLTLCKVGAETRSDSMDTLPRGVSRPSLETLDRGGIFGLLCECHCSPRAFSSPVLCMDGRELFVSRLLRKPLALLPGERLVLLRLGVEGSAVSLSDEVNLDESVLDDSTRGFDEDTTSSE